MSPNQQPLGIDPVGSAGKQGDIVLSILWLKFPYLPRIHDTDLIHFVGQQTVQHGNREGIAFRQLVQVGKQPGAWQPPVGRQDAMVSFASYRQAGALQMSHRCIEHCLRCTVINRQLQADTRDMDISHHSIPGYVEDIVIPLCPGIIDQGSGYLFQRLVVSVCCGKFGFIVLLRQIGNDCFIICDGSGLYPAVPPV